MCTNKPILPLLSSFLLVLFLIQSTQYFLNFGASYRAPIFLWRRRHQRIEPDRDAAGRNQSPSRVERAYRGEWPLFSCLRVICHTTRYRRLSRSTTTRTPGKQLLHQ